MLTIDGSLGEGGGQILRTSLALAAITRTPVRIHRIRAGRAKPGLQRQHLVAVRAAARACQGRLEGDALGSSELTLEPQQPACGTFEFDIGSAGSTTLVLQTVLPILLHADGPSSVGIRGGTHNSMAPPVEFLQESFLPVLRRIGVSASLTLLRHGFYPAGGGAIRAEIQPWSARTALQLLERGPLLSRRAEALVANLPAHIAQREGQAVLHALQWSQQEVAGRDVEADGPGNALVARIHHTEVTAVLTAFGEQRTSAEVVAGDCCRQVRGYLASEAPVCEHLADQLLLPLALGVGGTFLTCAWSEHARTNALVIGRFLGEVITYTPEQRGGLVTVRGRS